MPPKASSPTKKNKVAKSDPFGGMLSLTGSALSTQQLQQEAAIAKSPSSKNNKEEQEELIGTQDTTKATTTNADNVEGGNKNDNNQENENENENQENDEEEILCSNNVGTAEDREFDELIGAIEGFLVSDELESSRQEFFNKLPNPSSPEFTSLPQQEKYICFKKYVEFLDELLDKFITGKFPGKKIEDLAAMIMKRKDEVSMDVMELVSGGEESGLDYESFVQMWELYGTSEEEGEGTEKEN